MERKHLVLQPNQSRALSRGGRCCARGGGQREDTVKLRECLQARRDVPRSQEGVTHSPLLSCQW